MNNLLRLSDTLLIGDDPYLLAELSSLLGHTRTYVPVFDGPRMWRNDADIEVTLLNNAAARSKAHRFLLAGLPEDSNARFLSCFPKGRTFSLHSTAAALAARVVRGKREKLRACRSSPGLALLAALRANCQLEFDDGTSDTHVQMDRGRRHLVACEAGDLHAEVVAANYAYAFAADLVLMPRIPEADAESLLSELYGIYEQRSLSATDAMRAIIGELRTLSNLEIGDATSVTFFTSKVPWGVAFPELPSSHIFNYPSVGLAVFNGVAGLEQAVRVCVGVDPVEVKAVEIEKAAKALVPRGVYMSVRRGSRASVRNVSRTLELYPYDLLLISTHCGDADGWRWTYQYPDRDGRKRTLVIDVAISVADIPNNEHYEVIQYERFVSLDGVDWADREAKKRLPVGTAILDYLDAIHADPPLQPVHKVSVPRVRGSAALRMSDGNYLAAMRTLADHGQPIVINNACASWHELAGRFAYAGCRLYVGTLFSVSDAEAQEVISQAIEKHPGKPIALATWHVQRDVYGDSPRRPYAVMGVYFQPLQTATSDAPRAISTRLRRARAHWTSRLADPDLGQQARFTITDYTDYIDAELALLSDRWGRDHL